MQLCWKLWYGGFHVASTAETLDWFVFEDMERESGALGTVVSSSDGVCPLGLVEYIMGQVSIFSSSWPVNRSLTLE